MNPIIRRGITHQFKLSDISNKGTYSGTFETDKLKWKIHLGIDTTNGKKQTFIRLIYCSENAQDSRWICDVTASIAISKKHAQNQKMAENLVTCFYGVDGLSRNVYFPTKLTKIFGFFERDHTIYINLEMHFKYFDFSQQIPNFTDLKLLARDNTEFHVNKGVICAKSEFFYDMFVNQKPAENNYQFFDVSLPTIAYFLAFCYSSLDGFTDVMETIHLASFYRVSSLRLKCEKYYIDSKIKCKLERKLWIAETFGLEQVMTHALKSVKCRQELKALQKTPEFTKFTDSTKCRILARLLELV